MIMLFIIARNWEQVRCTSIDKKIDCALSRLVLLPPNRNKLQICERIWVKVENILLNKKIPVTHTL
jgi:hypothetical protein